MSTINPLRVAGQFAQVHSEKSYDYARFWYTVATRRHLVFSVRACRDAHVALADSFEMNSQHVYEVVIGARRNTYVYIRDRPRGPIRASVLKSAGLLHCDEFRSFWILWEAGRIEVGKGGDVGVGSLLRWRDPAPRPIHGVSVSTVIGVAGDWQFEDVNSK